MHLKSAQKNQLWHSYQKIANPDHGKQLQEKNQTTLQHWKKKGYGYKGKR